MYKRQEYENIDELTWKITLNDGVVFSNGRACDGEAVKESLEALVANHERAAGDLCICLLYTSKIPLSQAIWNEFWVRYCERSEQ